MNRNRRYPPYFDEMGVDTRVCLFCGQYVVPLNGKWVRNTFSKYREECWGAIRDSALTRARKGKHNPGIQAHL